MGRRRKPKPKRKPKTKTKSTESNPNHADPDLDLDLPEEPLIKILESFHVKSLCRFRCVSNRWNSIISDPIFIRHYVARTCSLPWTLLFRDGYSDCTHLDIARFNRIYSDDSFDSKGLNPDSVVSVLDFPCSVTEKHKDFPNEYRVLASSEGLLLCSVENILRPKIYYVCNPVIGEWIALPSNTRVCKSVLEGLVTRVGEGGIVTSYKVVLLMEEENCFYRVFEIFDSVTGEWTVHRARMRFPLVNMRLRPFCFNGILHYNTSCGLIAYDPYTDTDKWRLISLRSTSLNHYSDFLCGVSNGRLSCVLSGDDRIDVWVLEDYCTAKWHLEYKNREHKSRVYPPFAFHPFDSTIIYTYIDTRIFSYDLVSKKLDMVFDFEFGDISGSVVLPFVLPPWLTHVPKHSCPHGKSE